MKRCTPKSPKAGSRAAASRTLSALLANDQASLQALQWLSFGYAGVDGIRELDGLGSGRGRTSKFTGGREADHAAVAELLSGLERHIAAARGFLAARIG